MTALAVLTDVCKAYGGRLILRGIDLEFFPGNLTLLTGANGAGKSTLLRLLAGLAKPTNGKISRRENSRLSYLGHATFIYPGLSAFENLAFWTRAMRLDFSEKDLLDLLKRVNLKAHAHDRAGVFSRGMAQRLNFARILAENPDLLLLDEPFSGLDRESREMMRAEILRKVEEGACAVMVSHSLETDIGRAQNIIVLKGGKVAYAGKTAQWREGAHAC